MEGKRIIYTAVLVALIIVTAIVCYHRLGGGQAIPERILKEPMSKMDTKTMEIVTLSREDWQGKYKPDASGYYKNPKTGEYTMAEIITCARCGKQVPEKSFLHEITQVGILQRKAVMEKLRSECVCPYCKKNPYGLPTPSESH